MLKRVFFDITHTSQSGKNSGIEKLVRSLLKEFESPVHKSHVNESSVNESSVYESSVYESSVCWVDGQKVGEDVTRQVIFSHNGRYYPLDKNALDDLRRIATCRQDIVASLPRQYAFAAKSVCRLTQSKVLKKWLLPSTGHLGAFKVLQNYREYRCLRDIACRSKPIVATQNDLFLCPDAYWPRNTFWEAAAQAKEAGAVFSTVLFDLIPISHPELVGEKQRLAFERYLIRLAKTSDLVLAISETVSQQFVSFLTEKQPEALGKLTISWFPLGCDLNSSSEPVPTSRIESIPIHRPEIRPAILGLFDRSQTNTPYLMVASFEPRKNHRFLLDAFDRIWNNTPALPLCLVGRIGWLCNDLLDRIASHPLLGKSLFVFHDLSDKELQHCYSNARGVILPSLVEGFGLPVIESLRSNRKVFISDTPIHREVGSQDCIYFGLDSITDLIEKIAKWEEAIASGASIDHPNIQSKTVSWKKSFETFFKQSLETFRIKHLDSRRPFRR